MKKLTALWQRLIKAFKERIKHLIFVFKVEYRRGYLNYTLYRLLSKNGINKAVKNDIKYYPNTMLMTLIDIAPIIKSDKALIEQVEWYVRQYYQRNINYEIGNFKNSFKD